MKILITGATGYIGSELVMKLVKMGHTVNALVRNPNSERLTLDQNINVFKGNILEPRTIEKAMKGCEAVIHVAAYTNLRCTDVDQFYKTNVLGTRNILDLAQRMKVKKVIYTSTLAVYGPSFKNSSITETQPRLASYANDYELTKAMAEEVVQDYVKQGLNCVILNVSKVYGPGPKTFSNGVNQLIRKIQRSRFLFVPNKMVAISNYVYIDDVVAAHILAIDKGAAGERYIIGGTNLDYQTLFSTIKELTKSKVKIVQIDYKLLKWLLSIINVIKFFIGQSVGVTPKMLDVLFMDRKASSQKAIDQLNYKKTQLRVGLLNTLNHLKLQS